MSVHTVVCKLTDKKGMFLIHPQVSPPLGGIKIEVI